MMNSTVRIVSRLYGLTILTVVANAGVHCGGTAMVDEQGSEIGQKHCCRSYTSWSFASRRWLSMLTRGAPDTQYVALLENLHCLLRLTFEAAYLDAAGVT